MPDPSGEDALIARHFTPFAGPAGLGLKDDAALMTPPGGCDLVLTADALKTADVSKGRALFTQHCAACHKLFGEGGDTAPDLTG